MKLYRVIILFIAASILDSCLVENDMAYPKVLAEVLSFEVEGQKSVSIDKERKVIEIVLLETADMSQVEVTHFTFSDVAVCQDLKQGDILDLTDPVKFVLKTYQEYEWQIVATQPIERYVRCKGQIGDAEFDLNEHKVYIDVSDNEDITAIEFESMKLEREGSVIKGYEENGEITAFDFPLTLDCNAWRYFIVECGGEDIRWGVFVATVEVSLSVTQINAWTCHADIEAIFDGTGTPYFRYKPVASEEWSDWTDVDIEGTTLTASITGLEPDTEYDLKLVNGALTCESGFETGSAQQIANMSFDSWYQIKNAWYPNESESVFIWDSANDGTANLPSVLGPAVPTTPTSDVAVAGEGKQAAQLKSSLAAGKFAAGNIYTGKFGKATITPMGATLEWGVPFEARPSRLKGWYKYLPVSIDKTSSGYEYLAGKIDTCQIQIMVTDWDEPFQISTGDRKFVDVDTDSGIIAYGVFETGDIVTQYKEFYIDLEYRDLTRKPNYIVITACASKYGDYFTGGVGSTLLVDEFELVYE